MTQFIANCPRCKAKSTTFDLLSSIKTKVELEWRFTFEAGSVCRECYRMSIFILRQKYETETDLLKAKNLENFEGSISRYVDIEGFISSLDMRLEEPPEFLPQNINSVFMEGMKCKEIGCWNAAGTMFRLALDLTTKELLPSKNEGRPNSKICGMLSLRLQWLFSNNYIPQGLKDLSNCVRQDGNDGSHDGTLTQVEVEDLYEFTFLLLERIFTEPKRIENAANRRAKRRGLESQKNG